MAQGGGAAGPAEGDAKAVGLMAEMENGEWGQGRLTAADRVGTLRNDKTFTGDGSVKDTEYWGT